MCNKLRKVLKSKIKISEEINSELLNKKKRSTKLFHIEKDVRLKCPFANCGKKFRIRGNLNIHIRTHTGERNFLCKFPDCDKSFATKGNLKSHISVHTGNKVFCCEYPGCDKKYSHLCRLIIHKRTHTGKKPYSCPVCSKSFNEKGNFITHYRIHSGEKPFICSNKNCGRSFKAKSHLKDHEKTHLNYKPFICDICKESFSRQSTLRIHKIIHTGEKPHICPNPYCSRRFADKGNMKNHFRLHYKNESKEIINENFKRLSMAMKESSNSSNSDSNCFFWKNESIMGNDEKSENSVSNAFNSTFPDLKKDEYEFKFLDLGNNYESNRIFNVNIDILKDNTLGFVDDYSWNDIIITGCSPMEEMNFINSSNFFADNY